MEDWYKINKKDIIDNGGAALVNTIYKGSPAALVTGIFTGNNTRN